MNKTASILIASCLIALLNISCEKETFIVKNLELGCVNNVFSVPGWYTDSISYSDDKVSLVDKKFKNHDEKNTRALFAYSSSAVQIVVSDFSEGFWSDAFYYNLSYNDSKISQIETNSNRVKANYYYNNGNLSYILYHRGNLLTDSIMVEYDNQGYNIARAKWYKFDEITNKLTLANTAAYTYDTKNNPHRNSVHFLYNFYDCEEYSLDYFNRNNLKSIESTLTDIHTEYTYNDYGYPVAVIFYDATERVTDTNTFSYKCN